MKKSIFLSLFFFTSIFGTVDDACIAHINLLKHIIKFTKKHSAVMDGENFVTLQLFLKNQATTDATLRQTLFQMTVQNLHAVANFLFNISPFRINHECIKQRICINVYELSEYCKKIVDVISFFNINSINIYNEIFVVAYHWITFLKNLDLMHLPKAINQQILFHFICFHDFVITLRHLMVSLGTDIPKLEITCLNPTYACKNYCYNNHPVTDTTEHDRLFKDLCVETKECIYPFKKFLYKISTQLKDALNPRDSRICLIQLLNDIFKDILILDESFASSIGFEEVESDGFSEELFSRPDPFAFLDEFGCIITQSYLPVARAPK